MASTDLLPTPGIHHVTAIARDPQRNLDFYTQVLGLRLVKRTVNFDDPGSYHFYFGDQPGSPGTLLTFFLWPGAPRGRPGAGQATTVSFAVPAASLGYWSERLRQHGVATSAVRAGIGFRDPDGLQLELVGDASGASEPAIRGLAGVALSEHSREPPERLLTETFGMRVRGEGQCRVRYETGCDGPGTRVEVLYQPERAPGRVGAGTVHHVAFRARTDAEQQAWRAELLRLGFHVTPVLDRCYFRSIYFREPGGVLFEIATDGPGFAVDEARAELGRTLRLPPWLEPERAQIEGELPALEVRNRPPDR